MRNSSPCDAFKPVDDRRQRHRPRLGREQLEDVEPLFERRGPVARIDLVFVFNGLLHGTPSWRSCLHLYLLLVPE
jgi:hypothetical protein